MKHTTQALLDKAREYDLNPDNFEFVGFVKNATLHKDGCREAFQAGPMTRVSMAEVSSMCSSCMPTFDQADCLTNAGTMYGIRLQLMVMFEETLTSLVAPTSPETGASYLEMMDNFSAVLNPHLVPMTDDALNPLYARLSNMYRERRELIERWAIDHHDMLHQYHDLAPASSVEHIVVLDQGHMPTETKLLALSHQKFGELLVVGDAAQDYYQGCGLVLSDSPRNPGDNCDTLGAAGALYTDNLEFALTTARLLSTT